MFFKRQEKSGGVKWLVVGLGNPGDKYEYTRHNVGFLVVDTLARRLGIPVQRLKHHAHTNTVTIGGQKVLLMKPITYMNLSGKSVADAAFFHKVPPDHVLVICDDVALPLGKLRIRREGSAGGHNGLKSIIQLLRTEQFPRLKLGVGGKPHPDYDMADWVLSQLSGQDRSVMDETVKRADDAVECILTDGIDAAMAQFN